MACACWGVASLGYSRRARLYGASCSRFYLRQEVALRQPKVTAQLPIWGGVSTLNPMRSSAGFCCCAEDAG